MGTRAQLAAALAPLLPATVKVIPYPREIDPPDGATTGLVILQRRTVQPGKAATQGSHLETFALWLIEPMTDEAKAEDSLDDNLDELLAALETVTWATWETAERSTFMDLYAAYRIDLQLLTTNTTKETTP